MERIHKENSEKLKVRVVSRLLFTSCDYDGLMVALFHGILGSNVASRKDNKALEKKRKIGRVGGLGGRFG